MKLSARRFFPSRPLDVSQLCGLALALAATNALAQSCLSWSQISTVGGPSPRYNASMGFDSDRGVLIIHGGAAIGAYQFDTWEYDGRFWTRTNDGPLAISGNAMEYDRRRHKMIFSSNDNHLYEYDIPTGSWQDAVVVPGNNGVALRMAFDEARGVMLLVLSTGTVYTWDGTNLNPAPSGPSARGGFGMAYDSDRQRIVFYGGRDYVNANVYFTDTWEWDGASWEQKSTVGPNLLEVPPHTIYDRSRHRIIAMAASSNAAYDWNGSFWTQIDGTGPTPTHNAYSLVYDQTRARMLLFGGTTTTSVNELWAGTSPGPVFTIQPANFTATQGSGAVFAALCTDQARTYQWRKNGVPIRGATSPIYSIPSVSPSDAGKYDVIAYGDCNATAASSEATLTVSCYANCDRSTAAPVLNVNDFMCFLNKFSAGCQH